MTNLKLIFPNQDYKDEWFSIINEIENAEEKMTPSALKGEANDYNEYLYNVKKYSKGINLPEGRVPAEIYFLVNNDDKRILGAIDIRYSLNDYLYNFGGNIGYGIRPTERRKGYATKMLELALDICREKGMDKVLITCNKSNIGSARTIIKNGGILENEIMENDELVQRYWIKCSRG
ncbi:acetyltransferase (GNAT) family protein [Clostridium homopropionicum DSM 5847]|uniref:Acetyltransferase (GNAT) family protein n=1 Tax=Clostridium homopropionicum DSM 5847 TaxID=1121318 RepID=A0A0L6Z7A6_9CLOT|nr:GNAT family N-acetyltransferase [Clostridium homopropionicum]KOA18844.1 acetyltransferase (GNAT) family protein [Clostridium homopropionicum DSM 5847]SFG90086.1 Predicted acetyltransferase [Clostridium homopropionicum]